MNFFDQLRTLDPRDVGRWPLAVRGFFVVLGFAVVAAAGWYFFLWNDERPLLQKAQADEQDLRSQFENKQQRAANLDAGTTRHPRRRLPQAYRPHAGRLT